MLLRRIEPRELIMATVLWDAYRRIYYASRDTLRSNGVVRPNHERPSPNFSRLDCPQAEPGVYSRYDSDWAMVVPVSKTWQMSPGIKAWRMVVRSFHYGTRDDTGAWAPERLFVSEEGEC